MARIDLKTLGDPVYLDCKIAELFNASRERIGSADTGVDDVGDRDAWKMRHVVGNIGAGIVEAVEALTLATVRLTLTVEALMQRYEPVEVADDTISILSDPERLPPEKTASGERTSG